MTSRPVGQEGHCFLVAVVCMYFKSLLLILPTLDIKNLIFM